MIIQIGHAAFAVRDLAAARRFYCEGLGLEEAFHLTRDDGSLWIVYLKVGKGSFLELFPRTKVTPEQPAASYRHLCLLVDDLPAFVADLKSRGVPLTSEVTRGKDGNLQAWTLDPEGNRIELLQVAPDSQQARAG